MPPAWRSRLGVCSVCTLPARMPLVEELCHGRLGTPTPRASVAPVAHRARTHQSGRRGDRLWGSSANERLAWVSPLSVRRPGRYSVDSFLGVAKGRGCRLSERRPISTSPDRRYSWVDFRKHARTLRERRVTHRCARKRGLSPLQTPPHLGQSQAFRPPRRSGSTSPVQSMPAEAEQQDLQGGPGA